MELSDTVCLECYIKGQIGVSIAMDDWQVFKWKHSNDNITSNPVKVYFGMNGSFVCVCVCVCVCVVYEDTHLYNDMSMT